MDWKIDLSIVESIHVADALRDRAKKLAEDEILYGKVSPKLAEDAASMRRTLSDLADKIDCGPIRIEGLE